VSVRKRGFYTAFVTLVACAAAWFVGVYVLALFPNSWMGAFIGASAGLVTVLSAACFAVFGKLDKIIQDAEKHDSVRVRRINAYVHGVRRRLLVYLVMGVLAGLSNAGIALLLPKIDPSLISRILVGLGSMCAAYILVFMLQISIAYLSVDKFRFDLFEAIDKEDRRLRILAELRPSRVGSLESRTTVSA
jgi:hypothetical protein